MSISFRALVGAYMRLRLFDMLLLEEELAVQVREINCIQIDLVGVILKVNEKRPLVRSVTPESFQNQYALLQLSIHCSVRI